MLCASQIRMTLWVLLLIFQQGLLAQSDYEVHHLSSELGLPDDTVYDLYFDGDGWMWIATSTGLYKYDGVDFLPFRSSLARHQETHNLQLGADGELYVTNFQNQIFKVSGDSLALVVDLGTQWSDYASYATMDSGLLVHIDGQLAMYPYTDPSFPNVRQTLAATDWRSNRITPLDHHTALITDRTGKVRMSVHDNETHTNAIDQDVRLQLAVHVRDSNFILVESPDSKLEWRFIEDGKTQLIRTTLIPVEDQELRTLALSPIGELVLGGSKGVFLLSPKGSWTTLVNKADVSSLAYDLDGNLWVSTLGQGLLALQPTQNRKQRYDDLQSGLVSLRSDDAGQLYGVTRTFDLYALTDTSRLLLANTTCAELWSDGTTLRLGHQYSISSPDLIDTISGIDLIRLVKSALSLGDGRAAFATIAGVFISSKEDRSKLKNVRVGRARALAYQASRDRLWIAFADELSVYENGRISRVDHELVSVGPTSVAMWGNDKLFIGTPNNGLLLANDVNSLLTMSISPVGEVQGREVRSVEVSEGYAWVTTERGLTRIAFSGDGESGMKVEFLGANYGLPEAPPTALYVNDRQLLIAYGKTVYVQPVDIEPVLVRGELEARFAYADVAGQLRDLTGVERLEIEAGKESIALQPRVASYLPVGRQKYRYRIKALDDVWYPLSGNRPKVYFANLPVGSHVVELALDQPEAKVSKILIRALKPWYTRDWVVMAALCLALVLVSFIVWKRVDRRNKFLQLQADLRRTKLTAIASQMNPHFMFNALNSIQEFILDQDPVSANSYLGRFAHLMRLTLEHSRVDHIPLSDEIEAMQLYIELETLRSDHTIKVNLEVNLNLPLHAEIPSLLIQPFIENAFKHGLMHSEREDRCLLVCYEEGENGLLRVVVEDNGIGREASSKLFSDGSHKSFALSATKERMKLLNEALPDSVSFRVEDLYENSKALGTRITLDVRLVNKKGEPIDLEQIVRGIDNEPKRGAKDNLTK